MKQLTCEMCGSTDLIKEDGVFVCQSCGCKYSVEEAKRLMIEGTVDVQGTVKVDNSAFVEKYLANARIGKRLSDITTWWSKILLVIWKPCFSVLLEKQCCLLLTVNITKGSRNLTY